MTRGVLRGLMFCNPCHEGTALLDLEGAEVDDDLLRHRRV